MYGYKRTRLDLDADTHETYRYFALLRGLPVGGVLRRILADYAQKVEKDVPPIRVHMLAWREAMDNARAGALDGVVHSSGSPDLDEIPF